MKLKLPVASGRLAGLCAVVTLAVCATRPAAAPADSSIPAHPDAQTIAHVLNRIGFGARPGDVERVQKMGLEAYIDQQLSPERVPDEALAARLAELKTISISTRELASEFFVPARQQRQNAQLKQARAEQKAGQAAGTMDPATAAHPNPLALLSPEMRQVQLNAQNVINELMEQKLLRASMSERQLDAVLTDFWFNHFNVFVGKGEPERIYITEYERDTIRPHVLGKFRDLLGATAHSPAMLFYLDNWQSVDPKASQRGGGRGNIAQLLAGRGRGLSPAQMAQLQQAQRQAPRGLNENYGRELMELHTLGVDGGYTQADVINVARALTGWTIEQPQQGGGFVFRAQMHDTGEKTILGVKFPAGHGQDEGERVLDLLAAHPSTAHHIAFQLAQRLVADEPPAALVDRAAKKFLDTKGDLREVTRLIITSPEFFSAGANRAKVKTPLEFVVSAVRATGATLGNVQPMVQALRQELGMPLYGAQPPTGYSNTAEAWMNTGALLNRMNFALQLVSGGGPVRPNAAGRGRAAGAGAQPPYMLGRGRGPGSAQMGPPMRVDVSALAPDTSDAAREHLIETMLSGQASAATRQTLAKAQTPQNLIALTLGSPEFQRR
jgi:uncharacterized protein (DUF1800 family)